LAKNLDLNEWVATNQEELTAIAHRWASDLRGLAELRRGLRHRMEQSPLMDAPRFARNLEALYLTALQGRA
jgi:predicted O-linked N-acetylglucosamine transferase (SPINDLY family)